MSALEGKKRSAEEVDENVDENAPDQESPAKKTHAEKLPSVEPERRVAEAGTLPADASAASHSTNNNYTIIYINAASLSGPGVTAIVAATKTV